MAYVHEHDVWVCSIDGGRESQVTRDENVFFRHTLRLTDSLLRAGKPFDVLPLSGFTHKGADPVVAEQRWRRTVAYFQKYLWVVA